MENNNSVTLLNEGAIQDFVRSIFGKNFKTSVGSAAEVLLNKALNDVVSGGKKFATSSLRKTPEFKKAFVDLTAEASRVKYGKSFDDLVKFDKNAAQKLANDLQTGIEKEIAEKAAAGKNLIDADVKASKSNLNKVTKDVNAGTATAKDLKAATKELENAVKMQSKWAEAQKTLAGMDKMSISKIQKLLSQDVKVTTGTGGSISKTVGKNVVIKTMKGIFKTTKEGLMKFPGKVKKVVVNNKVLSTLTAAGLGAAALYYFYQSNNDTAVVLVDENGNPIDDNSKTNWGPCLSSMLQNKEAKIAKSPKGEISVLTPPSEKYPGGLNFYAPGRVMNAKTGEMGTWTCTAGQAQTNESVNKTQMNESIGQIVKRVLNERYLMEQQIDNELVDDVEYMVDYLDVPVWGNDYSDIYDLLKKYSSNGKYKEFAELYRETGIDKKASLRHDIESINAIDAKPVLWKRNIIALLNQIESGKVVPSTSTPAQTNQPKQQQLPRKVNIIGEQSEQGDLKIVWDKDKKPGGDGGSTGGGGTTTTKKTYYDCTNVNIDTTPLTYGCKSTKIAEIQKCLGVGVDGKFGPNTRKALIDKSYDVSNGITKDIYTKVLAACNPSASQTAGSTEGGADVNYLRTPIKLSSVDLGKIPSASSGTSGSEGMTDTAYFQSLVDKGYFNKTGIIGRYAYNGPALNPSDKEKIDRELSNTYGYYPTVVEPTETGARYVWKRN